MYEQIPFFGRENELAFIDELVREWGTRYILCIEAPGGLGKTRLLQELHRRYRQSNLTGTLPLLITDMLDLHDHTLHVFQNVAYRLAHILDPQLFDPYLFVLQNWRKMEQSGISVEQRTQSIEALNQTFADCVNAVTVQKRVILLVDSIDTAESCESLAPLLDISLRLENVLIILAGRTVETITSQLQQQSRQDVRLVALLPLSEQASVAYLHYKQKRLGGSFSQSLTRELLWLAQGNPILLDLAAEYVLHSSSDWGARTNGHEEASAVGSDVHPRQRDFVYRLARFISTGDELPRRLIRLMARVYPVDLALICDLLQVPESEARPAFDDVRQQIFVKTLPNERLELHDELRDVMSEVVWPQIDPDGAQRRQQSQRAAAYYDRDAQRLAQRLHAFERAQRQNAADRPQPDKTAVFMEQRIVQRAYWLLRGRQLSHLLVASVDAGMAAFESLFTEATRTYSLPFRATLFTYVQPYITLLSSEQRLLLDIHWVRQLEEQGQHIQAKQLATSLLSCEDLPVAAHIDILIILGNAETRLGFLDQGVANFERAVRISRVHDLRHELARALNARGWAYRNQGRHDEAMNDYLEAYQQSLSMNNWPQTAWILTNISFISALYGDRQSAFESSRSALKLWLEAGQRQGLAAAYSNLGGIHVRFNELEPALEYYTKALDIFTEEQDEDWMSLVRCGRAYVFHLQGALARADEDLDWSLKHAATNLKPRILYSQALVQWARGNLHQARTKLAACRALSQEIGDHFHDYKSFADLTELAWEFGEFPRWLEFSRELESLYAQRAGAEARRLRGSCLRKIGDLAICNGDYDAALAAYEEGFPLLAENEVHERYTIRTQMQQTNERIINRIPAKILSRLGRGLSLFWRSNTMLVIKYPEALLTFHQWEQLGDTSDAPSTADTGDGTTTHSEPAQPYINESTQATPSEQFDTSSPRPRSH